MYKMFNNCLDSSQVMPSKCVVNAGFTNKTVLPEVGCLMTTGWVVVFCNAFFKALASLYKGFPVPASIRGRPKMCSELWTARMVLILCLMEMGKDSYALDMSTNTVSPPSLGT